MSAPLQAFDTLLTLAEKRTPQLVADFSSGYAAGFAMCVPRPFAAALDVTQTSRIVAGKPELVWTQGSRFCFSEGDLLYDTPAAYAAVWSEALPHIGLAVQVTSPVEAAVPGDPRYPGKLTFKVYRPDGTRSKIVEEARITTTQDGFVRFLIDGKLPTDGKGD